MNIYAKMAFESAMRRLEKATIGLEDIAAGSRTLIDAVFADVAIARGEVAAAVQLIELEAMLEKVDDAPALTTVPQLRIVKS